MLRLFLIMRSKSSKTCKIKLHVEKVCKKCDGYKCYAKVKVRILKQKKNLLVVRRSCRTHAMAHFVVVTVMK